VNRSSSLALASGCFLVALSLAGCQRSRPTLVSAELIDESPDGEARQDETIRLTLDAPLPEGVAVDRIRVLTSPPADWTAQVERTPDPRVLAARIATGTPRFELRGIHGRDPQSTGIGIDWGQGVQWADLQPRAALPALVRAIWEDVSPRGPNLVVDQGDRLRLIFDLPVRLAAGEQSTARARTPQDFVLPRPGDRFDDGAEYASLAAGDDPHVIFLVLGSNPSLTPGAAPRDPRKAADRARALAPSTLALRGTRLIPMPRIADARGGPGAMSTAAIDIELPPGFPAPRVRTGAVLPAPGARIRHTVTPIAESRALIVGGASQSQQLPLDQVLVFDPGLAEGREARAFQPAEGKLPHPADHHTATLLAGPDGLLHTLDDVVLVAGGFDGERSLTDLTLIEQRADGTVAVVPLDHRLRVRRAEHAAVAVGPNRILIDGGRRTAQKGATGLVECAELLTISFTGQKPAVSEHLLLRTLARARHTLTLLAPSAEGEAFVLAHGGLGRDYGAGKRADIARRGLPTLPVGEAIDKVTDDAIFPSESASVLSCPFLIRVSGPLRVLPLDCDFQLAHARWGHAAVGLEPQLPNGQLPRPELVVIAGGSIHHPVQGIDGPWRLWELSLNEKYPPRGHEAASVLLFHFDPTAPERSRLEVLPPPAPDPTQALERLGAAVVSVPGLGVLLAGGEVRDGSSQHDTIELFLDGALRPHEMPVRLSGPRSRHQGYLVHRLETTSVFLIGGTSPAGQAVPGAVEEIPLLPIR
jgi:hypothetical protein